MCLTEGMLYLCRWCRYNNVVRVWLVVWVKGAAVMDEQVVVVQKVFVYICWGGYLKCGGNSVLTYHGGSSDCIMVRKNMRVGDVVKVVEGMIGEGLREHGLVYTMKFDRNMIITLQRDGDVVKLVKGNDEFSYMYVAGKEGLIIGPCKKKQLLG